MGSTQAKRRGAGSDQVDHRGRWVAKKGSRIVTGVYIDPEDVYADAICASKLALGGPIKYVLKEGLVISTTWLCKNVVPNIAKRYTHDQGLIRNLGLAMLWLVFDDEAKNDLKVPKLTVDRVKLAYVNLPQQNKPQQPVSKVPLHVYRNQDETIIDEVVHLQQRQSRSLGDELERVPASGGNEAIQHILQTLVIQQRNLHRTIQDLERRMNDQNQANCEYLETKFRTVTNNLRSYGATIQGSMARRLNNNINSTNNDDIRPAGEDGRRRGRVWPTLAPNIKDLVAVWQEYDRGLNGRKAAKDWTREERGGGGCNKTKQTYYRRNAIWKLQALLIRKGNNIYEANRLIKQTYGAETSITKLSEAIVKDRRQYSTSGGLHPNFR